MVRSSGAVWVGRCGAGSASIVTLCGPTGRPQFDAGAHPLSATAFRFRHAHPRLSRMAVCATASVRPTALSPDGSAHGQPTTLSRWWLTLEGAASVRRARGVIGRPGRGGRGSERAGRRASTARRTVTARRLLPVRSSLPSLERQFKVARLPGGRGAQAASLDGDPSVAKADNRSRAKALAQL